MADAASPTSAHLPAHLRSLMLHLEDLRDGTHGDAVRRQDKERLFVTAVGLLDPYATRALDEMNAAMLLDTGTVRHVGPADHGGGPAARWALSWPEQVAAAIQPVTIEAHFGRGFHHPHLRGGTVGEWPLNVFSDVDAAAELPVLRAIAVADLHNLVFQRDFRIVPAMLRPAPDRRP